MELILAIYRYIENNRYMRQDNAIDALSALSNQTRLEVFRLLVKAGHSGLSAGEISDDLGVLQNTMSTHLSILSNARLVKRTREGRVIRYFAEFGEMRSLIHYLLEDCCSGEKVICQPFVSKKAKCC